MALSVLESKAKENFEVAESIKETKKNAAVSRYYYACLLAVKSYLINDGFITENKIRAANNAGTGTHRFLINKFKKRFENHPDYRTFNNRFRKLESIREARNKADYDDDINYNSPRYSVEFSQVIADVRQFTIILKNYCSAPF